MIPESFTSKTDEEGAEPIVASGRTAQGRGPKKLEIQDPKIGNELTLGP